MSYFDTLKIKEGKKGRVSYSSLKEFAKSPLDYLKYINKDYVETEAMIEGSATDCLLLEPDQFDSRYMVIENVKRNTKVGKETYALYLEEAKKTSRKILKQDSFDKINLMVESIKRNPQADYLLMHTTEVQKRIKFQLNKNKELNQNCDPITINGITDGIGETPNNKPFIFDLKTTNDFGNLNLWGSMIVKWSYHLQASIYHYGVMTEKIQSPDFYHIVVENKEPYKVYVVKFSDEMIKTGRKLLHKLVEDFLYCQEQNAWHMGSEFHTPEIPEINLPSWYKF